MRKRRLILLLIITLLILSSCAPSRETGDADLSSDLETLLEDSLYLLKDGDAVFDLVYPQATKFENISAWVDQIKAAMKTHTGAEITAYSDKATQESDYLILLGDTYYSESIEELKTLGKGGYSVCMKGNYIIINGADNFAMVKAVNYFCNVLLKKVEKTADSNNVTLNFEEKKEIGMISSAEIYVNNVPLKDFVVIYPENDKFCERRAKDLVDCCYSTWGLSLVLSDDTSLASDHEILVGKTNRDESAQHSSKMDLNPMEYEYSVINGKLSLLGYNNNGFGLYEACESMVYNLMNAEKTNLEDGFVKGFSMKLNADKFASLADDSDIRVMTSNLMHWEWMDDSNEWLGYSNCLPRAEVFYANLMYYKPDVVGSQEVSPEWTEALKIILNGTDYKILYEKIPDDKAPQPDIYGCKGTNFCPIIYNSKTVEVVESGAYWYSIGGPRKARAVTWGIFKHKETQKTFIQLNTHIDWVAGEYANDYTTVQSGTPLGREQQVKELAETYNTLKAKYPNVDMFMTADWNTPRNAHPLDVLCEKTGTVFAENVIADNDWKEYEVDHILMTEDTAIKAVHCYYENGRDMGGATDHPWGFADIKLK